MAHPKEKRDLVRRKYVFENQPLELAATFSGVPLATARTWKYTAKEQGDDWDKARSAHLFAGGGIETVGQTMLAGFWCNINLLLKIWKKQKTLPQLKNPKH